MADTIPGITGSFQTLTVGTPATRAIDLSVGLVDGALCQRLMARSYFLVKTRYNFRAVSLFVER